MDAIGHAVIGAAVCGLAARWLRAGRRLAWAARVYGAVMGALPDLGPWVALAVGADRMWGYWYTRFHHEWSWWPVNPPVALHVLADKLFHRPEGGWYPWARAPELLLWAVAAWLVSWDWRRERDSPGFAKTLRRGNPRRTQRAQRRGREWGAAGGRERGEQEKVEQ